MINKSMQRKTTSEKFCFRWNDFEENLSGAFREIREEQDFFDVTLACDDNQMEAHKVIISACSPWFRSILRWHPHQHPLLYLKGVKYSELVAVLDFMYNGEVNIAQDDLNSFLNVASELQVKGLSQEGSRTGNTQSKASNSIPKTVEANPSILSARNVRVRVVDDDDNQKVVSLQSESEANSSMMDQALTEYLKGDQGAISLEDNSKNESNHYEEVGDEIVGHYDKNIVLHPPSSVLRFVNSLVWKFFNFIGTKDGPFLGNKTVKCKHCKYSASFKNSTSALQHHMTRWHKELYEKAVEEEKSKKQDPTYQMESQLIQNYLLTQKNDVINDPLL